MSSADVETAMTVVGWALVVVGVVLILWWHGDKKEHLGVSWFRRRAIRRNGIRATATIIDRQGTKTEADAMILEVERPGAPRYRVQVAEEISLARFDFAMSGSVISVFVDPDDPKCVVIDLAELDAKVKGKELDAQERQEKLLRGD